MFENGIYLVLGMVVGLGLLWLAINLLIAGTLAISTWWDNVGPDYSKREDERRKALGY